MKAALKLPRLYAIVDAGGFPASNAGRARMLVFARELLGAGVTLLQYRDKQNPSSVVLANARELRRLNAGRAVLVMNDRADLTLGADFDGVHLGQEDLSAAAAREILGEKKIIGVSTHNLEQFRAAAQGPADYVAIGPIFATQSKENPDAVVGLKILSEVRKLTRKPIVAIGGITRGNCRSVIDSGADSVAVISDLAKDFCEGKSTAKTVEEFLRILG